VTENDNSGGFSPSGDPVRANLGEMLRHARELRELSLEDLAHCLRLEPRIIRHLENDQFDQLPAPAFTRGYVRSIAKELDIDSAPLLAVLDLRFKTEPPPLSDFESRAPVEMTSDSGIIRYTTVGLVIVIIVMVALWWRAHDDPGLKPQTATQAQSTADPATAPLPYDFEIVVHPDTPFYRLAPAKKTTAPATGVGLAADVLDAGSPAPSATDAIVITTREDAWIDVRDAIGARLFYDLARSGREVRLSGIAPYALTIGNAPAVSVEFRGRTIALEPYSEGGIARFELGEPSAQTE
jgi:cytoskeleton protein RodZ